MKRIFERIVKRIVQRIVKRIVDLYERFVLFERYRKILIDKTDSSSSMIFINE